ncbi:hypothetical protein EB796_005700 [Bugula neritina]|uniref:Uncharacterized protein n=1 Tax=Bugula neritina TaxID=10212 RepID=A0A7J7KCQ5_BUGNE|nr:hypothetical protein EB796_005700 [Bugula neritina]
MLVTSCTSSLLHEFSFLSERCHPVIKEDHVTNIYRMMVDIAHPSLYYIGLYKLGSPFREFCVQADLAAALIAEKIPTPSREEMEKDYQDTCKKNVTYRGLKPKNFHTVSWNYYDTVCKQTGQQQPDSIMAKKLYNRFLGNFYKDFFQFKRGIYKRLDSENFEVVYEPEVFST